jgi:hypothetical protein
MIQVSEWKKEAARAAYPDASWVEIWQAGRLLVGHYTGRPTALQRPEGVIPTFHVPVMHSKDYLALCKLDPYRYHMRAAAPYVEYNGVRYALDDRTTPGAVYNGEES